MSQNVIVIGGGIIGLTIAQRLAENGFRITVLERDLAGLGASVRSAGLHFPVGRSTRVRSMTRFSQAHYEHRMGAIDRMRPLPMRVHMSEAAVERILPWFLPEAEMTRLPGPGGLVAPVSGLTSWAAQGAHHTDVGAYTAHLFQSMPPGVERREGCRVTELRDMAGGVEVGLADGTELHADHAVLAPGPWFGGAEFRPLTAGLGLRVKRIVAFHIDVAPEETDAAEYFVEDDAFLLPLVWARRWLFSYTCEEWDVTPDAVGPGLSAAHRKAASEILSCYVPDWAGSLSAGRVFCDAYSADRKPVIQRLGAHGNVIFAGGANGAGYRLAPSIAEHTATLIEPHFAEERVA
ncbi:MAG: FAD-binding oxidoreductase [Rhodobacteraceae bacterium]|jgi:D-arginine dehydrogenase|nr:FAD-binding oxidoreductase [Paracoccaceae bacterium]